MVKMIGMDWLQKAKKPKGKEWLLLSLGISLLCFALVYFFVHGPMQARREQAQTEALAMRREIQAVEAYRKAHAAEPSYEKDLLARQARADQALPDRLEQGVFLGKLQQLAFQHKIKLTQVVPKAAAVRDGLQVMPVEVRFRSSYFELLSFLRSLREDDRYIQVARTTVQEKDGALNCQLELRIYAVKEGS